MSRPIPHCWEALHSSFISSGSLQQWNLPHLKFYKIRPDDTCTKQLPVNDMPINDRSVKWSSVNIETESDLQVVLIHDHKFDVMYSPSWTTEISVYSSQDNLVARMCPNCITLRYVVYVSSYDQNPESTPRGCPHCADWRVRAPIVCLIQIAASWNFALWLKFEPILVGAPMTSLGASLNHSHHKKF